MAKRRSIRDILSGSSKFLYEFDPSDLWICRIMRSTIVRGEITSVLVDPEFLSLGAQLIRAQDIPGNPALKIFDQELPILAHKRVEYFGQPIALLVAPDEESLNAAERMIQIRYNEEPFFGPELSDPGQIHREETKVMGEPSAAWKLVSESLERQYDIGARSEIQQESPGSYARWTKGELQIISPTVWPQLIVRSLSSSTGLDPGAIHVTPANPGVFHDHLLVDGSLHALYSGLAACICEQSVGLSLSEEEQLLFGTRQFPVKVFQRIGLDEQHQVMVRDIEVDINTGAYCLMADEIIDQVLASAPGLYRAKSWRLRIRLYRSNIPPTTVFHGAPALLLQIPAEIEINNLAEISRENPLELRKRQLLKAGELAPPDFPLKKDMDSAGLLAELEALSDFHRRYAACELLRKRRDYRGIIARLETKSGFQGIGMAYGFQPSGFTRSTEKAIRPKVRLRMDTDGSVHAFAFTSPGASAAKVHIKDIIVEELGVESSAVKFHSDNPGDLPDAGPVCMSRSLTIYLDLFRQACRNIQKQRFHNPLPLDVSVQIRSPRKTEWDPKERSGDPFLYRSYGALAVSVEVDPITFIPEIGSIWMVVDIHSQQNIAQARSALEGSLIRCLQWLRGPESEYRAGVLSLPRINGRQYRESLREPEIHIRFVRTNESKTNAQSGFRDLPTALLPAAYLSALNQATGGNFDRVPIDSQSMFEYLAAEPEQIEA